MVRSKNVCCGGRRSKSSITLPLLCVSPVARSFQFTMHNSILRHSEIGTQMHWPPSNETRRAKGPCGDDGLFPNYEFSTTISFATLTHRHTHTQNSRASVPIHQNNVCVARSDIESVAVATICFFIVAGQFVSAIQVSGLYCVRFIGCKPRTNRRIQFGTDRKQFFPSSDQEHCWNVTQRTQRTKRA